MTTEVLCHNHDDSAVAAVAVLVHTGPPEQVGVGLCASCVTCTDLPCTRPGDVFDSEYGEPWCAEHAAAFTGEEAVHGPQIVALDSDRYRDLTTNPRHTGGDR
ncbi:hypothetical protein [Actinokineospora inagensis]|uniref:hypothetical protein n=1 Tax=Actinokineospora inagensis TaxID=103730 RepID=UPI00040A6048|nr:hypothetical protein [Actinokineospora inagensis]